MLGLPLVASEADEGEGETDLFEHELDGEGEYSGLSPALPDPAEPSGRMSVVRAACRDR